MRSYQTARTLFSILEFGSWCAVIIGALALLYGFSNANQGREFGFAIGAATILPGAFLVMAGLLGAVQAQIGRAGVDTAEYSQQLLKVARDHLEISRQGLRRENSPPNTFTAVIERGKAGARQEPTLTSSRQSREGAKPDDMQPDTDRIFYRGKEILKVNGSYLYKGIPFKSRMVAESYIDSFASPELPALSAPLKDRT